MLPYGLPRILYFNYNDGIDMWFSARKPSASAWKEQYELHEKGKYRSTQYTSIKKQIRQSYKSKARILNKNITQYELNEYYYAKNNPLDIEIDPDYYYDTGNYIVDYDKIYREYLLQKEYENTNY